MSLDWRYVSEDEAYAIWDDLSSAFRGATFFHTRKWAEVLGASFSGWEPAPLALEFSDGNMSLLPQMKKTLFNVRLYGESMLPGVYGGPLFLRPPSEQHWYGFWNAVNQIPNMIIYGNPFVKPVGVPEASRRIMSTQVLDLTPGINKIMRGFRKGHLAATKAARRKGLEISIASSTADVTAYFLLYREALVRWGDKASGFYPESLFQNLFRLPGYGENLKLWLARSRGAVIAGIWVLCQNEHAVYWHGATDSAYLSLHPAHLLVTGAIEDASENGFRWFDFNPSGGLEGVDHFKRGFGATRLEFLAYRRLGLVGKAFRLSRYLREAIMRARAKTANQHVQRDDLSGGRLRGKTHQ